MNRLVIVVLSCLPLTGGCTGVGDAVVDQEAITWKIDNLEEIGGARVEVLGSPQLIRSPQGTAIAFDGEKDGIILDTNPLSGASSFTVEVIFRPDPGGAEAQRFLHFQASEERRVLIETRLNDQNEWFLDTYIKSDESDRTLQSKAHWRPLGLWYHAALVLDRREMRHYVNGVLEDAGTVNYSPVQGGQTSIGCRLNRVFWYKGAVSSVRITHRALTPGEFLQP